MRTGSLIASLVLGASLTSSAARPPSPAAAPPPTAAAPLAVETQGAASPADTGRVLARSDRALLMDAARTAWTYVDAQYQPATGLVNSVVEYRYATVWDIGSGLAALYCADQLDLLEGDEYDRRMRRALRTLREADLFDDGAFNKNYATATGRMAGRNGREDAAGNGYGWSALDLGRLLLWLKIIAHNQPQYAGEIQQIVDRLDMRRLVEGGYLRGEDLSPENGRKRRYQEGKLGYEQYAALGFAAWGARADSALSLAANTYPIEVLGVPLLADRRGGRLTSEPFLMMGMETGWTPEMRELAWRLLAAQEERWRRTGDITIASEDALNRPPYFLYYSVWDDGKVFAVEPPAGAPSGPTPRTVSTKAAFAWHALLPSAYTWKAVERVSGARTPRGWGAGVFESDGRISGGENVNTAAMVLEAALYVTRGKPFLEEGVIRR
jgi:hypothetical protein